MRTQYLCILGFLLLIASMSVLWYWQSSQQVSRTLSPLTDLIDSKQERIDASSLTFNFLKFSYKAQRSPINIIDILEESSMHTSYKALFETEGKSVSAQINVPKVSTPSAGFPTIVMLRGYVDPAIYQTGVGTRNAAAVYAQEGFVTVAPDFLGYGDSDKEDKNSLLARMERPRTVLNLLESVTSLDYVDSNNIGMWGHSNGGQIALSVLEITGKTMPTVLWAPVSKSFPYSILYYTDEYQDKGRALRQGLSEFEQYNQANDFSIDEYFHWIQAPLQIHQGESDEAIPVEWTNDLIKSLEELDLNVIYYRYPDADHNMRPNWNNVVQRDIHFFSQHLKTKAD